MKPYGPPPGQVNSSQVVATRAATRPGVPLPLVTVPEASPPLFLFAPGAGAPSASAWMRAWAARLAALGRVEAFDYPYRREGRRAPDRLPVLIAAHREALRRAREGHRGPVFLAGKSMGGRVGCHVAADEGTEAGGDGVAGVICFGYPLVGTTGAVRDEVLLALRTPILFLQGSRDPLCPLGRLEDVRQRMAAESTLYVVTGGDHSLQVRKGELKTTGRTQDEVDRETLQQIAAFVARRPAAKQL